MNQTAPPSGLQTLTIQQAVDLAMQHHIAGRLTDAESLYQQIVQADPNHPVALHFLGVIAHKMGNADAGVGLMTKALEIAPNYAEAHNNLGSALKDLGRLEEAVVSHQKALAIRPDNALAHFNLGNAFEKLGNLNEAVASYHKALVIKPDYAEAWNNLKFAARALQFSKAGDGGAAEGGATGLDDTARASIGYAMHQFYLASFNPHEAGENFDRIIAALPSIADQTIKIDGQGHSETEESQLPTELVALLMFGRSGTGFLHSLIDGHPEIWSLPSVYLRGYFNEGVWENLSADGWRRLPQRFADEFAVLFDARSAKPIPSRLGEPAFSIGQMEGMTAVGKNRDEFLSVDKEAFCAAALRLLEGMPTVDPMSFLMVVHAAFEEVVGAPSQTVTDKRLCFYHIHNPNDYAMPNFLRYGANTQLLMTVREPIQNCESSLRLYVSENSPDMAVHYILGMLFAVDQIAFRMRQSVGIRLEDIKVRPEATMQSLCAWLGVKDSPSLYEMTAQGKKWWGDPSSPDYAKDNAMAPFDNTTIKRPVGQYLGEKDQFIFRTLFYPFSVRFAYQQPDPGQFQKDLKAIRPLLGDMMDFEKRMADHAHIEPTQFKRQGSYQLLRAGMHDRWDVLNEYGTYPHMLEPLPRL